ncbi:MAG: hypothetical protein HQL56_08755 [Magnetococcales bacterium]|nr:hypothetical protein [Magnetococcales bacterium]
MPQDQDADEETPEEEAVAPPPRPPLTIGQRLALLIAILLLLTGTFLFFAMGRLNLDGMESLGEAIAWTVWLLFSGLAWLVYRLGNHGVERVGESAFQTWIDQRIAAIWLALESRRNPPPPARETREGVGFDRILSEEILVQNRLQEEESPPAPWENREAGQLAVTPGEDPVESAPELQPWPWDETLEVTAWESDIRPASAPSGPVTSLLRRLMASRDEPVEEPPLTLPPDPIPEDTDIAPWSRDEGNRH